MIYVSGCVSLQLEILSSLLMQGGNHGKARPSCIEHDPGVGYDPETRMLGVVFNSGQTYCYEDVPPEVHQELMAAGSKGQYMRAAIIGVYPDYRVSRRRRR
jgi:hypothetical protein